MGFIPLGVSLLVGLWCDTHGFKEPVMHYLIGFLGGSLMMPLSYIGLKKK